MVAETVDHKFLALCRIAASGAEPPLVRIVSNPRDISHLAVRPNHPTEKARIEASCRHCLSGLGVP